MDDALERATRHALIGDHTTLPELPDALYRGLIAVSILAFLSLVSTTALFFYLGLRLFTWKQRRQVQANQFVVLIFNLILADIQQSVAFVINSEWVRQNSIVVGGSACWVQGWFISTGDLSSGLFTFAIAVHSLADIVYDYRVSQRVFKLSLILLWTFNYACAGIGIAMHSSDFYVRAGAWCWINMKYINERLWLHYFWIIIAEFGTVVIYAAILIILRRRVQESLYTTSAAQLRAQSAMKLIIAYPTIYVVCTLPLVIARLKTMAGYKVDFVELCVAAAMITSNGWLDVLLYSMTRSSIIFGSDITNGNIRALETFTAGSNWRPDRMFGTTTTVEAMDPHPSRRERFSGMHANESLEHLHNQSRLSVKVETTVDVSVEDMELEQYQMQMNTIHEGEMEGGDPSCIKGRLSFDTETTNEK